MKILCVIDNLGAGGAQRQIVELALGFKAKGHHVSFLTYYYNSFFISTLQNEGIAITCIEGSNYLKRLLKMRRFIRKGNYNAIISFLEAANFICEFAGIPFRKWKLVVGERSANPKILTSLKLKIYRWFHFLADYVVANSYANMEIVQTINPWLPQKKCKVIYNSIDFNKWKPNGNIHAGKSGVLKIVVAASHQYLKNLNGLIEALALLSKEEQASLVIHWYGHTLTAPYIDNSIVEGKQKVIDLGLEKTIYFHSSTDTLNKIFQEADVVSLFSFYEGFPNVVCEGMACEKPILSSSVSDLPKLLEHNKNLLFDPTNPTAIKEAISYILKLSHMELLQIGQVNRKIAKENFDKETNISKYLKLLSDDK